MDENWVKIFASTDEAFVHVVKGMLIENEINAVVLNKKDTMYNNFGDIELYVDRDDAMKASTLIEKFQN